MAKDPVAEKVRTGAVDANKWPTPSSEKNLAPVETEIKLPPVRNNPFEDPPDTAPFAMAAPALKDDVDLEDDVNDVDAEFDNLKLDVTEIDDVLDPHTAEEEKPADVEVGDGNHPSGLPVVLMSKDRLVKYLSDHGVTKAHRDAIEYTETERRLYEIYKTAKRNKRTVTKAFFTTALRMYRHGWPLNIDKSLDLNKLKIGE